MNATTAKIHQLINEASDLSQRTTGELVAELASRIDSRLMNIKIMKGRARIQEYFNFDNLQGAAAIDAAMAKQKDPRL